MTATTEGETMSTTIMPGLSAEIMRESLLLAVKNAARAVSRRNTLPVLANVLLTVDADDNMTVCGTDLETVIAVPVVPRVSRPGAITVNAKALADAVKNAPKNAVLTLTADDEQRDEYGNAVGKAPSLTVAYGNGATVRLAGISATEFPSGIMSAPEGQTVRIWSDDLRAALESVAFAAATDEAWPILTTVHFYGKDRTLRLAAADNYALAYTVRETLDTFDGELSMALTISGLSKLIAMLPDGRMPKNAVKGNGHEREAVTMTFGKVKSYATFSWGYGTTVHVRAVDGQYPNYQQVIPTRARQSEWAASATFERAPFLAAVKSAGDVAKNSANVVCFEIGNGAIAVSAQTDSGDYAGSVPAETYGAPMRIALNAGFVTELGDVPNADRLTWRLQDSTMPSVFERENAPAPYTIGSWATVIMPVRSEWAKGTAE